MGSREKIIHETLCTFTLQCVKLALHAVNQNRHNTPLRQFVKYKVVSCTEAVGTDMRDISTDVMMIDVDNNKMAK